MEVLYFYNLDFNCLILFLIIVNFIYFNKEDYILQVFSNFFYFQIILKLFYFLFILSLIFASINAQFNQNPKKYLIIKIIHLLRS